MGEKTYSLEDALKAQSALRSAAGLVPERFPMSAVVGMISDEIEILRGQGKSDDEIAALVTQQSSITISAAAIAANYASPEQRSHRRE